MITQIAKDVWFWRFYKWKRVQNYFVKNITIRKQKVLKILNTILVELIQFYTTTTKNDTFYGNSGDDTIFKCWNDTIDGGAFKW